MDPKTRFKIRRTAYIICLLVVAVAACAGFYQNYKKTGKFFTGDSFLLEKKEKLLTDSDLEIKEGDKVNVDFVGYVDGKEVKNGSTQGRGLDVTVGSGRMLPGMEEQLIGHHPGETFTMTITFADDYSNEELRGKEASLEMTVNGIYGQPK